MSPRSKSVWRRAVSVMGIAMAAALILLVVLVVRLSATNDENHLEEVMAGANGNSRIQFIVMREEGGGNCWGPQNAETQSRTMMVFFDASGRETGAFKFPNNPRNNVSCSIGNAPVLLATQEFANLPGAPTPDFIMPPLLNPLAGKVCFTRNTQNGSAFPRNDCLSYGAFTGLTGTSEFGIAFGPPAAALPIMNTVSLRRPSSATSFGSTQSTRFEITTTPTPKNSSGATFTIPVAPLRAQGENVFTLETFGGNGRACATCHVASQNFGMTPGNVQSRFATVSATFDPLFIGELKPSAFDDGFDFNLNTLNLTAAVASNAPCPGDLRGIITTPNGARANVLTRVSGTQYLVQGGANPPLAGVVSDTHSCSATVSSLTVGDLAKPESPSVFGLEFPRLMRTSSDPIAFPQGRALVLENVDGTSPTLTPHVFRKSPHLLNLSRTAPFGFSGDVPNLQAFLQGAINQHYPRSLARNPTGATPDFRLPTVDELRAAEAFMLAQEFPAGNDPNKFDLDRFATTAAQRRGRALFFGSAKCSQCHGGPVLAATTVSIQGKAVGINAAFNTGVVNQPINGAAFDNLPAEQGGNREFSVPQLFNVKNLGPLFHDASVPDVAEAVNFYASGQFNSSPAGVAVGGIALLAPDKADLTAFLDALAPRPYTLSTRVVRFGAQDKSAGPTAAASVTITNTSGAPITFSAQPCTLTGANPDEFNIATCPLTTPLAADESRTITVNFDPGVNGVANAAILEINAPDPSGVDLFGTGGVAGAPPTVTVIAPTSGSTLGGTAITVTGANFALGATVAIGGVDVGNVVVVSATTITASTGPHAAGLVDVVVTNPDAQAASLPNAFTYVAPPAVTSIAPEQGSINGGTTVTIIGSEFVPGMAVTIGGLAATDVVFVNATKMTAVTAAHAPGPADVKVTSPTTLSDTLVSGFTFAVQLPLPTISAISPTTGATPGGTAVTIFGTNFSGPTVSIGGVAATNVSVVSPTVITATTGPRSAGTVDVVVANADGGLATAVSRFTYQSRPSNDLFVNRFPITGGGDLTATGSNVAATAETGEPDDIFPGSGTARSVWWTWTAPCSFTVTSPSAFIDTAGSNFDTVLSVFTGPGFPLTLFASDDDNGGTVTSKVPSADTSLSVTAGTVFQIRVRGVSSTDTGAITLHVTSPCDASNAPMVSSISPTTGSSAGFATVTIAGTNFVSGAVVSIGGVPSPSAFVSNPTSITALTPQHVPGTFDVVVTNPDLQSGTMLNGFTVFAAQPTLAAINPTTGQPGTSPTVTLTGTNFAPGMTVDAGSGITLSNVLVFTPTTATATFAITSNATLGPRSVTVTTAGGTTGALTFTVVAVPTVIALNPTEALRGTAPTVTLTGTNFVPGMTVNAGAGITVSNIVIGSPTSATATFTIAANAPLGTRNLTVTTAGGTGGPFVFTVLLQAPTLTGIVPNVGVPGQSVNVTLTGTSFVAGLTVDAGAGITVSNVVLNVTSEASATATFIVAPGAALGARNVTVTNAAGTSNTAAFSVVDPFPDLTIGSAHSGNFGAGFNENYVLTVSNQGTAPTTDTIAVTDSLPAAMTLVSGSGTGWTCSGSQALTCTGTSALAVGASTTINLVVAVAGSATSGVFTNVVTVSTAGDLIPANDGGTDPTTVLATPTPSFTFGSGALLPGQQANVGVTLAAPFPHDVTGTVTMNFASNAAIPLDDPAIQFASGGRQATFVVFANTVQARFGSSPSAGPIFFQTGTVAGTFTFSGTLQAGTAQKTFLPAPGGPDLSIPKQAPSIQKVETSTQNGFAALINLQSTLREVTQMSLTFNTTTAVRLSCGSVAGCSVSGNTITFDVRSLFDNWFTSDKTFGGLSTLRLPLTISGAIQGTVNVTFRNSMGASNSVSFSLQ